MSPKKPPQVLETRWITSRRVAALLDCDQNSVYRYIRQGLITPYRLGRTIRIDIQELAQQMKSAPRPEFHGKPGPGRRKKVQPAGQAETQAR